MQTAALPLAAAPAVAAAGRRAAPRSRVARRAVGAPQRRCAAAVASGARCGSLGDRRSLAARAAPGAHVRYCAALARGAAASADAGESGSAGDSDAAGGALCESSEAANQDLLVFFYCLELEQALQRALNLEQYDTAQRVRQKLQAVDATLRRLQGGPSKRTSRAEAETELTSRQARVAVLKSQMASAVAEERYKDAAALRDELAEAELAALSAAATAAAAATSSGGEPVFALGQRVAHARHGWQGLVCGVEPRYAESDAWAAAAGVDSLPRGRDQPFYVVLPDATQVGGAAVVYCAEDMLLAPPPPPRGAPPPEPIEHPYTYLLFLGPDAAGGFVPTRALRDRYAAPRRDVHPPSVEEEEGDGDDAPQTE